MNGLLAPDGASRAAFWACVVLAFLAAGTALLARASHAAANAEALRAQTAFSVRVIAPADAAAVERAAAALRSAPGVRSAQAMSPDRAAALIEAFGGDASEDDLDALRLIEAEAEPVVTRDPRFAERLTAALAGAGFEVEIEGPGGARAALNEARMVGRLGLMAILAMGAGLALATAFVWRARALARGEVAALLADIGATRGQAEQVFGEEAGGSAFAAGVVGAAAAAAATAAILSRLAPQITLADMIGLLGPLDLAPLAATPLIAALAATIGARSGAASAFEARR